MSTGNAVTRPIDPSLAHLLRRRAETHPDRLAYRMAPAGELTYGQLDLQAREVAAGLRAVGGFGDRVALLMPNGFDFVAGFLGCSYAGMVAVPLAYPVFEHALGKTVTQVAPVIKSTAPVATIASPRALDLLRQDTAFGRCGTPLDFRAITAPVDTGHLPGRSDLALLQFTSGSTTQPRGVMVAHDNILHNMAQMAQLARMDRRDVAPADTRVVSWLPLFHDMGLAIAMFALQVGGSCDLMTPATFLMRPFSWLEAMSSAGAHFSGAPNFAYELCIDRISAMDRARLDLSGWELALNAAEPVREDTIRRFSGFFAPAGFRASAVAPCYGIAEATVFVTGVKDDVEPTVLKLDPGRLRDNAAVPANGDGAVSVVGCGKPPESLTVRIVDHELGAPAPADRVGEIWVHGPNVGRGYWQDAEATEATFGGKLPGDARTYLRTGDLGFLHEGQLYITGRRKDLIIVDGRNYYPHDIERTVEERHRAALVRKCVAFTVDPGADTKLVVAVELTADAWRAYNVGDRMGIGAELERAVRTAVAADHQLAVHTVALLRPGSIPFTTSGKIQRSLSRQRYVNGQWTLPASPPLFSQGS